MKRIVAAATKRPRPTRPDPGLVETVGWLVAALGMLALMREVVPGL